MTINLISRVHPIDRLPRSKHSTEDPNERRRRQIVLAYGYSTPNPAPKSTTFRRVIRDTVEISAEGRAALVQQKGEL